MKLMKINRVLGIFALLMSVMDGFSASSSGSSEVLARLEAQIARIAAAMPTDKLLTLVIGSCPWDEDSESIYTHRAFLYHNPDVYTLGKSAWINDKYNRKEGRKYDTSRYFDVDFNDLEQLKLLARLLPGRFSAITFDRQVTKYWHWFSSKHALSSFLALLRDGGAFYIPEPGSEISYFTASFSANGFELKVVDVPTLEDSLVQQVIKTERYSSPSPHASKVLVARRSSHGAVNLGPAEADPHYLAAKRKFDHQRAEEEAKRAEQAALVGPTDAHLRELLLNPDYVRANVDGIIGSRDYLVLKRAYHDVWEKLRKTNPNPDYRQVVEAIIDAMAPAGTLTPEKEAEILSRPSNYSIGSASGSASRKHWMPPLDPATGRFK